MFFDERMLEELRLHKEKGLVKDCISRPYGMIRQEMKTEQLDKGWIAHVKNQLNPELKC
ncbi:hypothetical protein BY996DRAFT_6494614 [Phakopsora pachyrhizi]|nr:hypothetical protein BY996DRAFT_6494614 [Phakopsora pachyrhizi]